MTPVKRSLTPSTGGHHDVMDTGPQVENRWPSERNSKVGCVFVCARTLQMQQRKVVINSTDFSKEKSYAGIGICQINKMHKTKRTQAYVVKRGCSEEKPGSLARLSLSGTWGWTLGRLSGSHMLPSADEVFIWQSKMLVFVYLTPAFT